MSDLWLLVARGGSKGVPGKNLRRIGGLTLIEWKVRAACAAGATWLVCSSDSPEILTAASSLGCDTIERPAELASDTAVTADVVKHALTLLMPSARIVLLEPSAPFTTGEDYRTALAMYDERSADLIVGMKRVEPHPTFIGEQLENGSLTTITPKMIMARMRNRQEFAAQWTMNGACYVFSTEMFQRTGDIYGGTRNYGFLMDRWRGIEIDTPDDLELAEYAYATGKVNYDGSQVRRMVWNAGFDVVNGITGTDGV